MASLNPSPFPATPSPDPSVIARDFADHAAPKTFLPRNMPDIAVSRLYLDYTPVSHHHLLNFITRRANSGKARAKERAFKHVRLLVLDRAVKEEGVQGYAVALVSSSAESADGEAEQEEGGWLEEGFSLYTEAAKEPVVRKELLLKGVMVTGSGFGNWQEEVGGCEGVGGEEVAREDLG
ncbi:hypothetical protein BU16DRAFT_534813 [Lophium mytilinum]|uniref:Uncharacterized protein n=1 Tax=Lophium mytilinum TaxID=390894 RepID=A0A6A6R743_9PEZI|nr:hypothetical protein BU16DRAFT_534813 [Lophium mytilinum]